MSDSGVVDEFWKLRRTHDNKHLTQRRFEKADESDGRVDPRTSIRINYGA